MSNKHKTKREARHALLAFSLVFTLVVWVNVIGAQQAEALYLDAASAESAAPLPVPADEHVVLSDGAYDQLYFTAGDALCIVAGGETIRTEAEEEETLEALLARCGLAPSPLEMVHVDLRAGEARIEVATDFTCYETAVETVAYTTLTIIDPARPKGEIEVVQAGQSGTREVVYELCYADGTLLSRQAVEERDNTAVPEIVYLGTLVTEAAAGDTIKSVRKNADGSGYLIMQSGDSLHFTGSMQVKCTAYTSGHDGVGTVTYTGTTVRRGCVAVDKNVIPLGTNMFITTESGSYTYGMARAEDTGVRGAKIDLYMDSYEECISFGQRKSVAYFLD